MDKNLPAGSLLHELGWQQGAYIACSDLSDSIQKNCRGASQELKAEQLSDSRNVLILLSQACDIVAPCELEPTLEFVIARRPRKKTTPYSGNLNAYSTRFLELKLKDDNWYKAEAAKILHVSKQIFYEEIKQINLKPLYITEIDLEVLARWRANRYMRKALPDAFIGKIRPLLNQGIFDAGLEEAGSLYLQLEPFDESEHYVVRLFAVQKRGSSADDYEPLSEKMENILEEINEIRGLTCPYIEGEDNQLFEDVMRRNELTIGLQDHFVRWNLDYISLGKNDSEGIEDD